MAQSTFAAEPQTASTPIISRTVILAVALVSFSSLLLELALTRLFSVVLFYHFAFFAISVALLGLGSGGVFAHVRRQWLAGFEIRTLGTWLCGLNSIFILVALEVVLHTPVALEVNGRNFGKLTIIYLVTAIPFFFTGLLFSVLFARSTDQISVLYGADLLGGASACLAVVPLLNIMGAPNALLFASLAMAVASAIWARTMKSRSAGVALAGVFAVLMLANSSGKLIDIVYAKGIFRDPQWIEFAKWNAISRIEVNKYPDGSRYIVIDADANSAVMNTSPAQWDREQPANPTPTNTGLPERSSFNWKRSLMSAAPSLANVLRPHGEFAIIGPGGSVDVLRAVANGSPNVTAIEINPAIANDVMRGRYADFTYHLYERPEVHLHVTDGRSFVRNAKQEFDVVQMTLVDTWASTAAGAFALSENSLYTVDAFREYFEHLKPDGMIAITRWEFRQPREALRVVSVATEALHQLGVANPAGHFIVVSEGDLDEDGIPVVVLAKKSPFTREEEEAVRAHLDDNEDLVALYTPSAPGQNPFSALIARNDPRAFARAYPYNVAPVDDNAPFFFFTLKTDQVLHDGGLQRGIDWKVNLGVVVLGIVFAISLVAVAVFLVGPMALRGGRRQRALPVLYFVAIGLGYMLVEIAFIQRFVLFLGHPTYALTVVIFLLLLSSGAGSLLSRRLLPNTARGWIPLVILVLAIALYTWGLTSLLSSLIGLPFFVKFVVSAVLLVPLGFAMGMPFPTGLRAIAYIAEVHISAYNLGEPANS